ncbi:MAG TPA: transporter substrate-binding domain-containing protein [Xanthobacteraceae bacterium]|nr:transporter substrate-binding domain-containing protein [Xanthobacteraceae bacterium]
MSFDRTAALKDLTCNGRLRAAINLGNPILAQRAENEDGAAGVTVALAKELAARLDVPLDLVKFPAAGKVFDAVGRGEVDLVFLAIEPARESEILFTAPYVLIEGNFVVREDNSAKTPDAVDRRSEIIAVNGGAAYDLYLSRMMRQARILRFASHEAALNAFRTGEATAAAGIRQPMAAFSKSAPGLRLIDDPFMTIRQALGVPQGRAAGHAYICSFIEEMKNSGFVHEALQKSGKYGATIPPPAGNK